MTRRVQELMTARRLAERGDAVRIRLAAGLSQSEIASACEVSTSTVCRWENGQRRPRGAAAIRWARVLQRLDVQRMHENAEAAGFSHINSLVNDELGRLDPTADQVP
jgi:transcriptional regulator with XRE-family HTH domain